MSMLHLVLIGLACAGLVVAVVLERRREREETRLWKRLLHSQVWEPDLS